MLKKLKGRYLPEMYLQENVTTYLGWFLNKFIYNLIPLTLSIMLGDGREQILFGYLAFSMTLLVTTYTNPDVKFEHFGDWDFVRHIIFLYGFFVWGVYCGYSAILKSKPGFLNNQTWGEWIFQDSNYFTVLLWAGLILLLFCLACDWDILRGKAQQKIMHNKNNKRNKKKIENEVQSWKDQF